MKLENKLSLLQKQTDGKVSLSEVQDGCEKNLNEGTQSKRAIILGSIKTKHMTVRLLAPRYTQTVESIDDVSNHCKCSSVTDTVTE